MLNHKTLSILVGMLLLMLGSAAYAKLPPPISWMPGQLTGTVISPNTNANYTAPLKHIDILPITPTEQLRIEAEGDIAPFVTITQLVFPPVFKNGNAVTLQVSVTLPANTPTGEINGSLVLKRVGPALNSLRIVSGISGTSPISVDGRFTARMNAGATAFMRVEDNEGNIYLLKRYPKKEGLADENPVIDAQSTAIALMLLQPSIITNDPYIDAVMFAIMAKLPGIQTLAELISKELSIGSFRIDGQFSSEILDAMKNASYALANMTKEDVYAFSISNKLNSLIANLWRQVFERHLITA